MPVSHRVELCFATSISWLILIFVVQKSTSRNASDHACFYGHFRLWISACTGSRQAGIINMVVCDKPYPILLAQKQWIVQYTDRPNVHKTLIHECCFYLEDCRQIGEPRICRSGSFCLLALLYLGSLDNNNKSSLLFFRKVHQLSWTRITSRLGIVFTTCVCSREHCKLFCNF